MYSIDNEEYNRKMDELYEEFKKRDKLERLRKNPNYAILRTIESEIAKIEPKEQTKREIWKNCLNIVENQMELFEENFE